MDERRASGRGGAWAGAVAVLLFVAGAVAVGDRPPFDAPGAALAEHFAAERTRLQAGAALDAVATPFLVWFLATVFARARGHAAAAVAFGCGLAYVAVFLVDLSALAVGALRAPELSPGAARLLVDLEWVAIGMATPVGVGMLAGFALLASSDRLPWPRWVGPLAAGAAAAYALRIGTLFTDDGPFAADGMLGLYVPVAALVGWLLAASVTLARRPDTR